jgi:hypothetical protein
MSKKDFKGGFTDLLGDTGPDKKKIGRPKDPTKRKPDKTSQEGTKNDETRATFIVKEELLDKIKALAYWEREQIKETINKALLNYVEDYETKSGNIKPIPKNKKQ